MICFLWHQLELRHQYKRHTFHRYYVVPKRESFHISTPACRYQKPVIFWLAKVTSTFSVNFPITKFFYMSLPLCLSATKPQEFRISYVHNRILRFLNEIGLFPHDPWYEFFFGEKSSSEWEVKLLRSLSHNRTCGFPHTAV